MLVLQIEYLLGRSAGSEYNARGRAEWPPHPARLFSALVATWAAEEERSGVERAALEWLETVGPPALRASPASRRSVVPHFVPDNPAAVIKSKVTEGVLHAARELERVRSEVESTESKQASGRLKAAERQLQKAKEALARELSPMSKPTSEDIGRARALLVPRTARQERFFPSVTPDEPFVYFIWDAEPTPEHRRALAELARRVTRFGHSSSIVRCTLVDSAPEPNWYPDSEHGEVTLRVVGPGQFARLEAEFRRHLETEPRILPCRFQLYREGARAGDVRATESVFGREWVVLRRVGGPRLPIERTVDVAQALRGALMKHARQPVPEILSGHDGDGKPSTQPHTAFVPLPFVGHRHADGTLLGVAVLVPTTASEVERQEVLRAIARWQEAQRVEDEENPTLQLTLGSAGVLEVEQIVPGMPLLSALRVSTWARPSRSWLSVIPVALDRNPGDLYSDDVTKAEAAYAEAAETLARSCERIGLPCPERVDVLPSATLPGTAKARRFPPFPQDATKGRRVKVHAHLRFKDPVTGPVLLGSGRYLGLGLFRPVREWSEIDD